MLCDPTGILTSRLHNTAIWFLMYHRSVSRHLRPSKHGRCKEVKTGCRYLVLCAKALVGHWEILYCAGCWTTLAWSSMAFLCYLGHISSTLHDNIQQHVGIQAKIMQRHYFHELISLNGQYFHCHSNILMVRANIRFCQELERHFPYESCQHTHGASTQPRQSQMSSISSQVPKGAYRSNQEISEAGHSDATRHNLMMAQDCWPLTGNGGIIKTE